MQAKTWLGLVALSVLCLPHANGALAQDRLKAAVGARGTGESGFMEVGQKAGIFKKYGIELDVFYTAATGETVQAIVSGGADIGNGAGTPGILGAYQKGAPIRIIGSNFTSDSNLYWYVKADSPIKTPRDALGKTVAYSSNGSSTHATVLQMEKYLGGKFKATATGSTPGTFTQLMSGQIDVGWSGAPLNLDQVEAGRIRVLFRSSDVPALANVTSRVLIAHTNIVKDKPELLQRFMEAFRESIEYVYKTPEGEKAYADYSQVSESVNKRNLKEFTPYENCNPDKINGIESIVQDALELKYLREPLTKEQLAQLIQIPPRRK